MKVGAAVDAGVEKGDETADDARRDEELARPTHPCRDTKGADVEKEER